MAWSLYQSHSQGLAATASHNHMRDYTTRDSIGHVENGLFINMQCDVHCSSVVKSPTPS